ncbi:MAG: hypothetical protein IBX69_04420 [Anaerolineales bacterium]|nr:hypothetical protein [Anaerolineales bacterium]
MPVKVFEVTIAAEVLQRLPTKNVGCASGRHPVRVGAGGGQLKLQAVNCHCGYTDPPVCRPEPF